MGDKYVLIGLKAIAWLKYCAVLVMAMVLVRPPLSMPEHAEALVSIAADHGTVPAIISSARDMERQSDMNEAEIKSLQRRLDLLEAMRIDASLSAMKATIDYDHALLMTIAGMLVLMAIGNALSHFKRRALDKS